MRTFQVATSDDLARFPPNCVVEQPPTGIPLAPRLFILADQPALSLGELIDVVVDHHLVDYCYIARDEVRISIRGNVLTYPTRDARTFLALLLEGWKRTPASVQTYLSAASTASPATYAAASETREGPEEDVARPTEETRPRWPGRYENYLNTVLAISEEMGLIVGFRKHSDRNVITILTQATKVEMSYIDAFEYLTSIIVQELRRRVGP